MFGAVASSFWVVSTVTMPHLKPLLLSLAFICVIAQANAIAQIREVDDSELIIRLGGEDTDTRRDAAYELVRRGADSAEVIRALGKATADKDDQVQFQALLGLAHAGPKAALAIDSLIECLDQRDDQVRYRAAVALGKIGAPVVQPLISHWPNASSRARTAAARALALVGPDAQAASQVLSDGLENGDDDLKQKSAEALLAIAPTDEQRILEVAQNASMEIRMVGISALAGLPELSSAGLAKMTEALQDSNAKIREKAIVTLATSAISREEKRVHIEQALQDSASSVRSAAIVAMRKARLSEAGLSKRLCELAREADAEVASSLVKALRYSSAIDDEDVPALLSLSGKVSDDLLAETLASMGAAAIPVQLSVLEEHPGYSGLVAATLAKLGPEVSEQLMAQLDSQNDLMRLTAVRALSNLPKLKESQLQAIAELLDDSVASVRQAAVATLVNSIDQAAFAKDRLLQTLDDDSPEVRTQLVAAVTQIGLEDGQLSEILTRALGDNSAQVRLAATSSVGKSGRILDFADRLAGLVEDQDAGVRAQVARTLANAAGGKDSDSLPEPLATGLVRMMSDSDTRVRHAALESVAQLDLDNDAVVAAVGENLADDSKLLRASLDTIQSLGNRAKKLTPTVTNLLYHSDASIRVAAIKALCKVTDDKTRLAQQLTPALEDDEWEVRRVASSELAELGKFAIGAVPQLFKLVMNEEDSDFAGGALRDIAVAPPEAASLFLEHLSSEDRRTAYYAAFLLGKIGPAAADALPALRERLEQETDSDFRSRLLREAIESIEGKSKDKK